MKTTQHLVLAAAALALSAVPAFAQPRTPITAVAVTLTVNKVGAPFVLGGVTYQNLDFITKSTVNGFQGNCGVVVEVVTAQAPNGALTWGAVPTTGFPVANPPGNLNTYTNVSTSPFIVGSGFVFLPGLMPAQMFRARLSDPQGGSKTSSPVLIMP